VEVVASCELLSSTGAVDIDLPQALAQVSLSCDDTLREVNVDAGGDAQPKRVTPPACNGLVRLSDLPAGEAAVTLETTLADGSSGPTLTCSAAVLPGLTVLAECSED
jgi:hypothetical protein